MKPHTIWSLWDMLRVHAKPFVEASDLLAQLLIATHDVNVKHFNAERFLDQMQHIVEQLITELKSLNLNMTLISAERLLRKAQDKEANRLSWRNTVTELRGRLMDEMGTSFLLALNSQEAEQYEVKEPPFGKQVECKFPGIIDELTEASKCVALARSTAAAFHYLRALESGLKAIYRCLGIPDPIKGPEKNWGIIQNKIKEELDRRWRANERTTGDARFFDGVASQLAAMRNPYRNETMHLEAKYTMEEARHIGELVNGIMNQIASRMDENGQPLA